MRLFSLVLLLIFPALTYTQPSALDSALWSQKDTAYQQALANYQTFEQEHGHFLQTPNVKLHYLTFGDPANTAMIWAHGTFGSAYGFADIAKEISDLGFYVIAIDYYGHGQTGYPTHEVSLYHLADDIRFLMDQLEIKRTIVGGLSRGGSVASAFYDAYPDRTLAIVLEDGGSVSWVNEVHKIGLEEARKRLGEFVLPEMPLFERKSEAFWHYNKGTDKGSKNWLINSLRQDANGLWGYNPGLYQWLGEDSLQGALDGAFRPTIVPLFEASTTMMQPKIIYRNLHVPLLIFDPIDERDWMKDFLAANQALQQQHPNLITHLVYEETGHTVHFERPERFTKDLIAFLKKVQHTNR